jgi:protease PrsW
MTPGWYRDPWRVGEFRWWDGHTWTAHVATPAGRRHRTTPRLPSWLSVPVIIGAMVVVPVVVVALIVEPQSVLLTLVPVAIVAPVLRWLDVVEPEPPSARLHALLWGATISIAVAGTVNSAVALTVSESAAAVVSAPLVEEFMKGCGVVIMVRRRQVDGVMDGLVYAGWVGLGFAMVENVQYFIAASDDGVLAETFVARALFTPFAHPLFTAWTGWAVGWAVMRGKRVVPAAMAGGAVAVGLHAAWNGSLVAAGGRDDGAWLVLIAALVFASIFVATIVMVTSVRRREQRRYVQGVGAVMLRYGVAPGTVPITASWRELRTVRASLPRAQRRHLDRRRAALARLVALHNRTTGVDPVDEARLVTQLAEATTGGPSR